MTVREINLGIPGLDRVLGGPLRLVERLPNQPSTSVLVRGGPGTGKTSLALHLAADIAKQLDGDVLFASVEMVASELRAIYDGTSGEDRLGKQVVDLVKPAADVAGPDGSHATVWFANLDVVGRSGSDVHAALESSFVELLRLAKSSTSRAVRAVVVDGLSDGYDLGAKAPRSLADGLVKFAAQEGLVLILVEETNSPDVTHWSFAVDISLFVMNEAGLPPGSRELRVEKSRYSAASAGPHLYSMASDGPTISPHPSAYSESRDSMPDALLNAPISLIWEPRTPMLLGRHERDGRGVVIDLGQPETSTQMQPAATFTWSLWRQPRILLAEAVMFSNEALKALRIESARDFGDWLFLGDLGILELLEPSVRRHHLECLAALIATLKPHYYRVWLGDSSSIGLGRAMVWRYGLHGPAAERFAQT
jgi:KaiC/GvpD/RAD55 family RecA-like ATPase